MNMTTLMLDAALQFWFIFPILILLSILKTSWFKGVLGEFLVNLLLNRLPKDDYHLIKNITLPTDNGSTQIDHIVVSKFGIFIIETKHMTGWIFGTAKQKQWTQKIYRKSFKFQNPIHQNYKHVKTVESLLEINGNDLFSIVAFTGDGEFKTDMPDHVLYARELLSHIKSYDVERLTEEERHSAINTIETNQFKKGVVTNYHHKKHIQTIIKQKIESNNCPKCNANMLLRESKKKQATQPKFWGCSTYPKCRGVREWTADNTKTPQ